MDHPTPDSFRSQIFTLKQTIAVTLITAPIVASATSETLRVCPSGCEFSSIQSALDAASDGDEIEVHPGTYTGKVVPPQGLSFTLRSVAGAATTIIDGSGRAIEWQLFGNTQAEIAGFTLLGGYPDWAEPGGCLLARDMGSRANLVVRDCVFQRGGGGYGGGLWAEGGGDLLIAGCWFLGNQANHYAGNLWLRPNTFQRATWVLRDCLVANGYSYNSGGLQVTDLDSSGASVLVDHCFFAGNRTPHGDGNNNIVGDNLEIRDTLVSIRGVSSTAIDLGGNDFEYEWRDCNEDNWHDELQILAGMLEDCDASGVPDICEMEIGVLADCDGNLVPDVCEGVNDLPGIIAMSGVNCDGGLLPRLCDISVIESRIAVGVPRFDAPLQLPVSELPARGIGDVQVSVIARGDLDGGTEFVVVSVDGDPLGTAFAVDGALCEQNVASFLIPAATWDVISSSNGTLTMFASNTVADTECDESRFELKVSYIGTFADCNANGLWDGCDVSSAASQDVDGDDTPDECQTDCDNDTIPDTWAIGQGIAPDCNLNGQPDSCDILEGSSNDVDANGVPDECKPDCNGNGLPDMYEIASGMVNDCNFNGRPDSCDIEELGEADCDGDGVIDICAIADGFVIDCNSNEIPDTCDLLSGTSIDVDQNAIPDECQPDCDADGFPDAWAIATGVAPDCNENASPDSCDIADGESDEDGDGTPDACELVRGDLDLDGCVGASDLGLMLGLWGIPNPPLGDLDGDGIIGPSDLGRLLGNWDC